MVYKRRVSSSLSSFDQATNLTHRPDGPGDDPAATTAAYEFFNANDGYHPVSLG
jgi:hypothetical protein